MATQSLKINGFVYYAPRTDQYIVRWKEIGQERKKDKVFNNREEALKELDRIRERIGREILSGEYDTLECRLRRFISIESKLKDDKKKGIILEADSKYKNIEAVAKKEAGVGGDTFRKGRYLIDAIDDLIEEGRTEEAFSIRLKMLYMSPQKAYEELPEKYKSYKLRKNSGRLDTAISSSLGSIARKIDERLNERGGDKYHKECIKLIKSLYWKIDEWRASE